MKLVIDKNICIKCGACASIAPETFKFDWDKGEPEIIAQPKKITSQIKTAIDSCPVSAIKAIKEK